MIEWVIKNKEWIFSGIGVGIISSGFILLRKLLKKKQTQSSQETNKSQLYNNGLIVSGNINNSGYIAGRDIHINQDYIKDKIDELIDIFNFRADLIAHDLSVNYKYIDTQKYIKEFLKLHRLHIKALKNRKLILAHEILLQIHQLSWEIEWEEFKAKPDIHESDDLNNRCYYKFGLSKFERGILICTYVVGDMSYHSNKYPDDELNYWRDLDIKYENRIVYKIYEKMQNKTIYKIYEKIYKSKVIYKIYEKVYKSIKPNEM